MVLNVMLHLIFVIQRFSSQPQERGEAWNEIFTEYSSEILNLFKI